MESGDLKIFLAVAQEGSITRAAHRLQYVQSNVTQRIRQLEAELQTELFLRTSRGMKLTPAGEKLLHYAEQVTRVLRDAEQSLRADGAPHGPLRIGAIESVAAARLPDIMAAYYRQYPEVQLSLVTGPPEALLQQVQNGELDGALVYGPVDQRGLRQQLSFREELILIAPTGETGAVQSTSLQHWLAQPMLFFSSGCTHRARVEQLLLEAGVTAPALIEFGSLEAIARGVQAGLGVALLPRSAIADWMPLAAWALPEAYRAVDIYLVTHADRAPGSAFHAWIRLLEQHAPTL